MCFIWLFENAPRLFSLQEMKAAAEPCVREFWACSWELRWFRLGDTCVLAIFLQDECLRVEIVFQDDVTGLYVNRPLLYMHGVGLESWIGPKGNLSRSRHDPRTWNCRLACMIIIKKTRHRGKKTKTILPYRIFSETLSTAIFCYDETFLYQVMSCEVVSSPSRSVVKNSNWAVHLVSGKGTGIYHEVAVTYPGQEIWALGVLLAEHLEQPLKCIWASWLERPQKTIRRLNISS